MDPSKWIEWIKLSPQYLFVIALTSAFLLFSSEDILNKIGVNEFVTSYRSIIGVVFLLFASLFLVSLFGYLFKKLSAKMELRGIEKIRKGRLKNLTDAEKRILAPFIEKQVRTQTLPFNDGTVNELQNYQIIYRSSNVSKGREFFSYNIQPWAWEYLNKRPHLLEINTEN